MKTINLPYGHEKQILHVEDSRLKAVLAPAHGQKQSETQQAIVQSALENPIGTPRLCELAKDKQKIVVITSDHTRPVPSAVTMPLLLQEIRKGNPGAEIILLVATGMHRPTTEAELLVSGDGNCAYFEVSAKKNTNVDEMFYVLFSMAKLPHEMSPALHRKISVQYGDAFHPRPFCMRRVKDMDAYGMVSPFARRPSVNSDLKYIKAKVLRESQARERDKCTIQ